MNKNLKKGGIVAIFTVIVIAAVIVVNLIAGTVPAKYRRLDLSTNQIFSLSDTTKDLLGGLTKDVNIYTLPGCMRTSRTMSPWRSRTRCFTRMF